MKWIVRIFISLLVLSLLALAVLLLPAHLQVRGVKPVLPDDAELLALRGVNSANKVSYIVTSSQALERGQISHISIVVEWASGKRFLIDTGMSPREAEKFAELLKKLDSSAGNGTVHTTISAALGSEIKDIAAVGFTHLHIDHTQGIKGFCNARGAGARLLQLPSQRELHNFNTTEGADLVENSCLKRADLSLVEGATLYQSKEFPGLAAFELGGHTPGSTLWAVAIADKVLLFSGDITNDKASIDHNIKKPALYSYLLVPENTKRTAELRQWLKRLDQSEQFSVIVSHDLANTQTYLPEFTTK
jgi:glyoxylase-like metal-dependent hydrolase (beta-lactamase superfamily II)